MEYLKVKNWREFQHYKKRNPPWIKLHAALLRDYEFSRLQDDNKLQLILIWLLASQMDGKIPNDPEWLKKNLGLEDEIDVKPLIEGGFLVDASKVLASCKQSASKVLDRDRDRGRDRGRDKDKERDRKKFDDMTEDERFELAAMTQYRKDKEKSLAS